MIKRVLYLSYYIRKLNRKMFKSFSAHVKKENSISSLSLYSDILRSSLKYNISILEYFQFHFINLNDKERNTFAGTGFMYEYQLLMNPKSTRFVLENKLIFLEKYGKFIKHKFCSLSNIEKNPDAANEVLKNKSGKIVLKSSDGQCGIGIEVRNTNEFTPEKLRQRLIETGNNMVEEFVVQHDDIMKISPSGLNTIRIITQLNSKDEVEILGARFRISVNSSVDNLAAGNIAAPIDENTGVVNGPGVYSDITKPDEIVHPITKEKILGFKIPFWSETLNLVKEAALSNKTNRSIGWDLAITNDGPDIIEGNHDWCKLLWQLPVKKGLKHDLEKYL
ncbi:MAG: hexapeptide transferase [Bacteroidetes bacterium]|nr:hexapeptide transferase [Bacteroidota bacterium]